MMKTISAILIMLLVTCTAFAADYYVDCDLATGANNGSSWADAYRSFAAMGSTPGNGSTIYISGGTDNTTCSGGIDLVRSWTIKPGAASPSPSGHDGLVIWSNGININGYGLYDVVIDGLVNGVRKFYFNQCGIEGGIYAEPKTITIRGIEFYNPAATNCVICLMNAVGEIDNVYINGAGNDADSGIRALWNYTGWLTTPTWGTFTIKNSTLRMPNSGDGFGADGARIDTGVDFYNNTFSSYYDANYTGSQHNDGVQINNPYGMVRIYNNTMKDKWQYALFMEDISKDLYIYNNVLDNNLIGIAIGKASTSYSNMRVENNLIIDTITYGLKFDPYNTSATDNVYIRNNIVVNTASPTSDYPFYFVNVQCSSDNTSRIIFDYNVHAAGADGRSTISGCTGYTQAHDGGTTVPTFVSYTPHAMDANDYHLSSEDTVAKDNGVTGYFSTDKDGNVRSGSWDIGPYEYGGVDSSPSAYSFTSVTDAALSTETTTDPCATVAGIDAGQTPAISISGTGCTYNIDGGAYGSDASTVGLDNVVCLRGTSSASYATVYPSCTLTIGGVNNTGAPWTVTTLDAAEEPSSPRLQSVTMSGSWK